jgi:hypothetical protein
VAVTWPSHGTRMDDARSQRDPADPVGESFGVWIQMCMEAGWIVRQPHLVMFEVLSLVVALFGACLVGSSPVRPVVGVAAGVGGVVQGGPEAPDFVAGQRDEVLLAGGGAPF